MLQKLHKNCSQMTWAEIRHATAYVQIHVHFIDTLSRDIQLHNSHGPSSEATGSQELPKTFVHIIHECTFMFRTSATPDTQYFNTSVLTEHESAQCQCNTWQGVF